MSKQDIEIQWLKASVNCAALLERLPPVWRLDKAESTRRSLKYRRGEGEILEIAPPRRLVHTMTALWSDEVKSEGTSRVTWEIEPVGDSCRLTLTHDQLREGANDQLYGGWPMILSGLKTLLETGELLDTPGSLLVARQGDKAWD